MTKLVLKVMRRLESGELASYLATHSMAREDVTRRGCLIYSETEPTRRPGTEAAWCDIGLWTLNNNERGLELATLLAAAPWSEVWEAFGEPCAKQDYPGMAGMTGETVLMEWIELVRPLAVAKVWDSETQTLVGGVLPEKTIQDTRAQAKAPDSPGNADVGATGGGLLNW